MMLNKHVQCVFCTVKHTHLSQWPVGWPHSRHIGKINIFWVDCNHNLRQNSNNLQGARSDLIRRNTVSPFYMYFCPFFNYCLSFPEFRNRIEILSKFISTLEVILKLHARHLVLISLHSFSHRHFRWRQYFGDRNANTCSQFGHPINFWAILDRYRNLTVGVVFWLLTRGNWLNLQ